MSYEEAEDSYDERERMIFILRSGNRPEVLDPDNMGDGAGGTMVVA